MSPRTAHPVAERAAGADAAAGAGTRIALVTNAPAPYRIPSLNRIAATPGVSLHAIYCCRREPNRAWTLPPIRFEHTFLRERISTLRGSYVHNNPDVVRALRRARPDVIVTTGFNPTHLYAFGHALATRVPHVAMTDGTYKSEQALSALHRLVRRFVYAHTSAFVWASLGGKTLYESYGVSGERSFGSCLCIENSAYSPETEQARPYDFMFCGRIEPEKNPAFALQVAIETARRLQRQVKILYVGSGSVVDELKKTARRHPALVDATFQGFAAQHELPALYRSARLFLFPSSWDVWGVVANEACAAGLPVLVSPFAGAAGELVRDGENGFVCPLELEAWASRATQLLSLPAMYREFSARSCALVSHYNFDHAADGLLAACRFAALERKRR